MTTSSFVIDAFDICWNAILLESKEFGNIFFNEKHCIGDESRDVNFGIVENRLAYVYRFGNFNVHLVRKCIASFIDDYIEAGKLVSSDNLKVCSLSNGPGFDLIGLLCSVCEINKCLKRFPDLRTINLDKSWWNISKNIFTSVYQSFNPAINDSFNSPSKFMHVIQGDIYSTLNPEAKDCIMDSDIILMVKVFASSKATEEIVMKTMAEIFSLLKPGSFVFFVGSKKNVKELTKNSFLVEFVNCILGPKKISVPAVPVDEAIVKSVGVKPKDSGYAYFIVWQKKDTDIIKNYKEMNLPVGIKKKKKRRKRKSKVNETLSGFAPVSNNSTNCINDSETSFSSCCKQSDLLSTISDENEFLTFPPLSIDTNKLLNNLAEDKHNLSFQDPIIRKSESTEGKLAKELGNDITISKELLDDMKRDSEKLSQMCTCNKNSEKLSQICICNKYSEKLSDKLKINSYEGITFIKSSVKNLGNERQYSSENVSSYSVCNLTTLVDKAHKQILNIEEKTVGQSNIKCVLNSHVKEELDSVHKGIHLTENNCSYHKNESDVEHSFTEGTKIQAVQPNSVLSVDQTVHNFEKNIQASYNEIASTARANSYISCKDEKTEVNEFIVNKLLEDESTLVLKDSYYDSGKDNLNTQKNTMHEIEQDNILASKNTGSTDLVKVQGKNKNQTILNRKSVSLSELNGKQKNVKKVCKTGLKNQSHADCLNFKTNRTNEEKRVELSDENNKNLNSLLQRFECLVTSLEEVTANLINDMTLHNNQNSRCCLKKSHSTFGSPSYINCCCINSVNSKCYRRVFCYERFQNSTCATCCKFHPCRSNVK